MRQPTERTWKAKFADAARGVHCACRHEKSFAVHFAATLAVVIAGITLRVSRTDWCLLTLCTAGVLVAETFNSALESLAKAVTQDTSEHIGQALDAAAGAVLLAAISAACTGALILLPHIIALAAPPG